MAKKSHNGVYDVAKLVVCIDEHEEECVYVDGQRHNFGSVCASDLAAAANGRLIELECRNVKLQGLWPEHVDDEALRASASHHHPGAVLHTTVPGYFKVQTGGGCTALQKSYDNGYYTTVTDAGGANLPREKSALVCTYKDDREEPVCRLEWSNGKVLTTRGLDEVLSLAEDLYGEQGDA